jgi:hypothetical protein
MTDPVVVKEDVAFSRQHFVWADPPYEGLVCQD